MLVRRRADLRRKPSQERSSFTFEAILDAAQQLVLGEGTAALQMSGLGRRAGVSAGTLYQYFPDRTSVFMALADRAFSRLLRDLDRALHAFPEAPLDPFLEALSTAVIELACRDHRLNLALRKALEEAGDAGVPVDATESCASALAAALKPRVDMDEEKLLGAARIMVWAADGLLDGALRRDELPVVELRTALLSAWRGILR